MRGRRFRPAWGGHAAALALLAPLLAARAADPLVIQHRAVDCVVAEHNPALSACFEPPERLARARVFSRIGATAWQPTDLRPHGACFRAVLPRPGRQDAELRYYIEAVDVSASAVRTAEKVVRVVGDTDACGDGVVAPFVAQAAASAHRSRVLPITLGALAVGGVVAVVSGRGGPPQASPTPTPSPSASPSPSPTPTPTPTPSATPSPPNPCSGDTAGPTVTVDAPSEGMIVNTSPVTVRASASDPNGVVSITLFARRPITGATTSVGAGTASPLQVGWSPECNSAVWQLFAQARDSCNNTSTSANRTVTVAVLTLSLCL